MYGYTILCSFSRRIKNAYNFYRLKLQMLLPIWAILQSAIPMNVAVHKTVALVLALAKIRYYCINAEELLPFYYDAAFSSAADEWQSEESGAIPLVKTQQPAFRAGYKWCNLSPAA
jgi:hypothetical protein